MRLVVSVIAKIVAWAPAKKVVQEAVATVVMGPASGACSSIVGKRGKIS